MGCGCKKKKPTVKKPSSTTTKPAQSSGPKPTSSK